MDTPMMPERTALSAGAPQEWFKRTLTIDAQAFFKSLSKAVLNAVTARPVEAFAELPEMADALGLSSAPEEQAWLLAVRGYERALCVVLKDYFRSKVDPKAEVLKLNWEKFEDKEIEFEVDVGLFQQPQESEALRILNTSSMRWLIDCGINKADAKNIVGRVRGYYPLGLSTEWNNDSARYEVVLSKLKSPFLSSVAQEHEWGKYRAYLTSLSEEPVFNESFSLRQIYVNARASFYRKGDKSANSVAVIFDEETGGASSVVKQAVWLEEFINKWLAKRDRKNSVKLISGGPGSGKSSFAKIYASKIALQTNVRCLFVPLHLLDSSRGIAPGIEEYFINAGHFSTDPVASASVESPILLIFDGLDELQMQGRAALEVSQQLVRDVARLVDQLNATGCRVLSLITGREMSVQSAEGQFRGEGEMLHVIPYFVPKFDREHGGWSDKDGILNIDQRDEWWTKFGDLVGESFSGIPTELKAGELGEVTSQPLLNYLVALSYRRGGIALDANTNINAVYADLLSAVHERGWAENPHPAVQGVSPDDFVRLLEEVAVSVWHGAGRTTTLKEVEDYCRNSAVVTLLPGFERGAEGGVSNLLLAFYFRQKGRRDGGDKTFEFTHKTFAEYLIALKLSRLATQISLKHEEYLKRPDEGWESEDCLYKWLSICGKSPIDEYVAGFLRREVSMRGPEFARTVQSQSARLLEYSLVSGWPVHRVAGLKHQESWRWARNAEEALVVLMNACARSTKEITTIVWPTGTALGEMIRRAQGQRTGPNNVPMLESLSYLDMAGCGLDICDLYSADLSNSIMTGCQLNYAILASADLSNTKMDKCSFLFTNIEGAKIKGATFSADFNYISRASVPFIFGKNEFDRPRNSESGQRGLRMLYSRLERAGAKLVPTDDSDHEEVEMT